MARLNNMRILTYVTKSIFIHNFVVSDLLRGGCGIREVPIRQEVQDLGATVVGLSLAYKRF